MMLLSRSPFLKEILSRSLIFTKDVKMKYLFPCLFYHHDLFLDQWDMILNDKEQGICYMVSLAIAKDKNDQISTFVIIVESRFHLFGRDRSLVPKDISKHKWIKSQ
jgi:hypothetical protein